MADKINKRLDPKKLGMNIRSLREAKGLTRQCLADRLNVDLSSIRFYESGRRVPSVDVAILLTEELGSDLSDLLS